MGRRRALHRAVQHAWSSEVMKSQMYHDLITKRREGWKLFWMLKSLPLVYLLLTSFFHSQGKSQHRSHCDTTKICNSFALAQAQCGLCNLMPHSLSTQSPTQGPLAYSVYIPRQLPDPLFWLFLLYTYVFRYQKVLSASFLCFNSFFSQKTSLATNILRKIFS